MKFLHIVVVVILFYVIDAYSYRRNCRNRRLPRYPFPWYRQPMMPYPQRQVYYNIVPPQPVHIQPAPVDLRYFHIDRQYEVQVPEYRPFPAVPTGPINPGPAPVNPRPIPINPVPINPGPGPVNPGPGPSDIKIPDPVVPTVPDKVPIVPIDPGPDPSRVDASDVGTNMIQQNSASGPEGVVYLSKFNGGFPIQSEVIDPEVFATRKTCSTGGGSCAVGEQCIFADVVNKMFYNCLDIPSVRCQCQPGCRFQGSFIPYGQSAIVDKCGNKCSCMNMYGNIECEKKVC